MSLSRRQRGRLEWTGEHWVAMLREVGSDRDSAIVSHYSLRRSPAGEGNVAVVRIDGGAGYHAVCTDNANLLPLAVDRFFQRTAYWDADLPRVPCDFRRTGDATRDPGWCIESHDGRRVEVRWWIADEPTVIHTPWRNNQEVFSILCFTDDATVQLDGRPISGRAYARDIWRDTLGDDRSSCVVALSESFFDLETHS